MKLFNMRITHNDKYTRRIIHNDNHTEKIIPEKLMQIEMYPYFLCKYFSFFNIFFSSGENLINSVLFRRVFRFFLATNMINNHVLV